LACWLLCFVTRNTGTKKSFSQRRQLVDRDGAYSAIEINNHHTVVLGG
jgi:hypothetical protein